ncbi:MULTISPECIES: hypothetical protein [unclassified Microbacterium]|uniref:hypothetical protein n=1 Tax=unclassified Microbacterium TaxID=2609290 RepID=UPI00214BB77C|nr:MULTISPECIES: hypothetical protein [unclassified Microbacterium]MCR2784027.1 hypothetical protein [Microbacterium sp. zg.B96]WIM15132.1 hypothetical protein QNO11_11325 [Microbacterium sp. zg-B96]
MTTPLTAQFIASIKRQPITVEHKGRRLALSRADGRPGGLIAVDLVVRESEKVVGYISAYGEYENGAIPARLLGAGAAPLIVRTLEAALDEILR